MNQFIPLSLKLKHTKPSTINHIAAYSHGYNFGFDGIELKVTQKSSWQSGNKKSLTDYCKASTFNKL